MGANITDKNLSVTGNLTHIYTKLISAVLLLILFSPSFADHHRESGIDRIDRAILEYENAYRRSQGRPLATGLAARVGTRIHTGVVLAWDNMAENSDAITRYRSTDRVGLDADAPENTLGLRAGRAYHVNRSGNTPLYEVYLEVELPESVAGEYLNDDIHSNIRRDIARGGTRSGLRADRVIIDRSTNPPRILIGEITATSLDDPIWLEVDQFRERGFERAAESRNRHYLDHETRHRIFREQIVPNNPRLQGMDVPHTSEGPFWGTNARRRVQEGRSWQSRRPTSGNAAGAVGAAIIPFLIGPMIEGIEAVSGADLTPDQYVLRDTRLVHQYFEAYARGDVERLDGLGAQIENENSLLNYIFQEYGFDVSDPWHGAMRIALEQRMEQISREFEPLRDVARQCRAVETEQRRRERETHTEALAQIDEYSIALESAFSEINTLLDYWRVQLSPFRERWLGETISSPTAGYLNLNERIWEHFTALNSAQQDMRSLMSRSNDFFGNHLQNVRLDSSQAARDRRDHVQELGNFLYRPIWGLLAEGAYLTHHSHRQETQEQWSELEERYRDERDTLSQEEAATEDDWRSLRDRFSREEEILSHEFGRRYHETYQRFAEQTQILLNALDDMGSGRVGFFRLQMTNLEEATDLVGIEQNSYTYLNRILYHGVESDLAYRDGEHIFRARSDLQAVLATNDESRVTQEDRTLSVWVENLKITPEGGSFTVREGKSIVARLESDSTGGAWDAVASLMTNSSRGEDADNLWSLEGANPARASGGASFSTRSPLLDQRNPLVTQLRVWRPDWDGDSLRVEILPNNPPRLDCIDLVEEVPAFVPVVITFTFEDDDENEQLSAHIEAVDAVPVSIFSSSGESPLVETIVTHWEQAGTYTVNATVSDGLDEVEVSTRIRVLSNDPPELELSSFSSQGVSTVQARVRDDIDGNNVTLSAVTEYGQAPTSVECEDLPDYRRCLLRFPGSSTNQARNVSVEVVATDTSGRETLRSIEMDL